MSYLSNPVFWVFVGIGVIASCIFVLVDFIKPDNRKWFAEDDTEYKTKKMFDEMFGSAIDRIVLVVICVAPILISIVFGVLWINATDQAETAAVHTCYERVIEIDEIDARVDLR